MKTVSFKVTAADRVLGYTDQQVTVNSDVTADISDLKRTELGIRLNLTWHLDASAAERYLYDFEYTDEENDNLSGYAKPDYQVTDDKGTNYGNDQIHIRLHQQNLYLGCARRRKTANSSVKTQRADH